ncbi:actin-like ATPase domain-containing protein [Sphaerulina musiva SO2202]|uniref:Actin-like ATPase domain-containing protein n=1 Tax=Sphaerulina musiva (strain SO2202) TaxID=692275 RepID=M3ARD5_SPHMS|nr:actin-like ATPase domain-containing protein [Sphaerulina musiva SO2202]EMF08039.1 actin-like ATPase domain-containing protein [Sphaerulina musiva SO2202]
MSLKKGHPGLPLKAQRTRDAPAIEVHKLVVGIDFGTTFTGVSHVSTAGAHEKTLDDVEAINDWPGFGRDGDFAMKTPTRLAYSDDPAAQNPWGYYVRPGMKSYSWMKLLLDPTQASKFDDPGLAGSEGSGVLRKPLNKTAVDVCADYLTEVAKYAWKALTKRYTIEVLKATPIEFWLTVPAVWSDKAKHDTLRAARKSAKQAKLECHPDSQIFLIREPEAAAVAVLSDMTKGASEEQIKVGDSVMIIDCGGGTVDITTYEISSIDPKLTFKEHLVGTGGKCGSTYIDREFIKWMTEKFGSAYTDLKWELRGPASRLMKEFESYKRDFGKSDDAAMYAELPIALKDAPESAWYDELDNIVNVFPADFKEMFKPVVEKILALVESQLDDERRQAGHNTIKTAILVGGFGDSVYLYNKMRPWLLARGVKLINPKNAQSAVVRGAALSGLKNIQPTSRRSRLHYGWSCTEAFDAMRHDVRDLFVSSWDGSPQASGNMRWPLSKGDLVDESTAIQFAFRVELSSDKVNDSYLLKLYCSGENDAPYFERETGVQNMATIYLNFRGVDMSSFESRIFGGRSMRRVYCDITVSFGHRRGVLVFSCTVNGKEIGKTDVIFDGQGTADASGSCTDSSMASPSCASQ